MDKDSEKPEIAGRNQDGTFIKGVSGNPAGKPKGTLSFSTKWERMVEKIAMQNNLTPEEIDEQLLLVGYKKAKDGDYSFYRDAMDRIHGKPLQRTELGGLDGEQLNIGVVILPQKNGTEDTLETTA